MPWNLLLLPLIGGYYILSRLRRFRYHQQRLNRQRLIFDSILLGIFLLIVTFIIRSISEYFFKDLIESLHDYVPVKDRYTGTTLFAFIFGVLGTEISNLVFFRDRNIWINKAIKDVGNEMELLLQDSLNSSELLKISLNNGKIYIAWVKELPIPSVSNYVRVIPAISGYQNNEKKIVFTTHYLNVYSEYIKEGKVKGIEELNIDLILPIEIISTISYFDFDMYEKFQFRREDQVNDIQV